MVAAKHATFSGGFLGFKLVCQSGVVSSYLPAGIPLGKNTLGDASQTHTVWRTYL